MGVGANRWKSLTESLANKGIEVHVVTVPRNKLSSIHENIVVHEVACDFFYKLLELRLSFRPLEFLRKVVCFGLSKTIWFDDEAQYWGKNLLPFLSDLHDDTGITHFIATGHPFQSNRWLSEFKKARPEIKAIQDFRDPWCENSFKGYSLLPSFSRQIKTWQDQTILNSDLNIYVTSGLKELMCRNEEKKRIVIKNGHSFSVYKRLDNRDKVIIHAGNITNGRDKTFECLLELINTDSSVLKNFSLLLCGYVPSDLIQRYQTLFNNGTINYVGLLSRDEVEKAMTEASIGLHLNSTSTGFALSTKLYEYTACGLPVLSITPEGDMDDIVIDNGIGVITRPNSSSIKSGLSEIINFDSFDKLEVFARNSHFDARADELIMQIRALD